MINICKFYKHERGCSCPYDCVQQLSTDRSVCVSDLYYAMGLKQERDCYFGALKEIEDVSDDYNRVEKTSQYYRDGFEEILDIIHKVKGE